MASKRQTAAFTLIELLVVVAIIGLLMSILLPNLVCAREQARSAVCGNILRSFGFGLSSYSLEQQDWFPGINTTGANFAAGLLSSSDQRRFLQNPKQPVQTFDWMTPSISSSIEMGSDRAERFATLIKTFGCPSQRTVDIDDLFPPGLSGIPDAIDFRRFLERNNYQPLSYLMPVHFQYWGQRYRNTPIISGNIGSVSITVTAQVANASWEAYPNDYRSRISLVGDGSRKVMAADGMRYMDNTRSIDFDITPRPTFFGSFTSAGAWWAGSTAYGVRNGSDNWDGTRLTTGSPSGGANLALSYRHTCNRSELPTQARDNTGSINAVFFDGHVGRMNDRESRNIEYWYPKGSEARGPDSEGMTNFPATLNGRRIIN